MSIIVRTNEPVGPAAAVKPSTEGAKPEGTEAGTASAPVEETEQNESESSGDSETENEEASENETETEGDEPEATEETEDQTETDKPAPKKRGGYQRRIDKLNARHAQTAQELEYWKQMALKSAGGEPKKEPEASKPAESAAGKPKAEDFETHAEFVEALSDWKVEQKLSEREQKAQKSRLETESQKQMREHQERVSAFAKKHEDFSDAMENLASVPRSAALEQIIVSSENGPELLYELAKDPKEAARIAKLPPVSLAREIGKLEARLASSTSEGKKPEPKKITKAPKPLEPVNAGGKGSIKKSIDDPSLSQADYERIRREQIKRRQA